jgi:glycolate oxidase FAD binding subunit
VLLEGTAPGVAERAKRMSELLSSAGGSVAVSEAAPARWGALPTSATVVRVSFWVSALGGVLEALAAAEAEAGVRAAVSGPAGAGALYACLDPDASDEAAARFVAVLRGRLGAPAGATPRGSVVVLAAPPPVLAAAGAGGSMPGAALMRAVKDQFDPDHRMFPGRSAFAGGD